MRVQLSRRIWVFVGLAVAIVAGGVAAYVWWRISVDVSDIQDYNEARDKQQILQTFQRDLYWLVANGEHFDPEHVLTTRSPSGNPELQGALNIKVLVEKGKTAGFITYYKASFYEGVIVHLSVTHGFRGKGYGKKLVRYATDDLFKQGCTMVTLFTRTSNSWARAIYRGLGFQEFQRDAGFVDYVFTR